MKVDGMQIPNSGLEAAREYATRGWSVVPVPLGEKNPGLKGWQNLRLSPHDVEGHFAIPKNVGILLGEPSGWLVDIDLDHELAVELAPSFLPSTGMVFGRAGKPRSHWLYRVTAPIKPAKFRSRQDGMLAELRASGQQTVFPPSMHASGERIEWASQDGEPASVSPTELLEAVRRLSDEVKKQLGESTNQTPQPQRSRSVDRGPKGPTGNVNQCLAAMLRMAMLDHGDGSARLFACACRAVEFNLDDTTALATIRAYHDQCPFPTTWTDTEILRRVRDAEKRCERGTAQDADSDGLVALGSRDPLTGRWVLSPKRTPPTATAFVNEFCCHPDGVTLCAYAGVLWKWLDNRFQELEDAALRQKLQSWLHEALRCRFNPRTQQHELVPFESNPTSVQASLETIQNEVFLPNTLSAPCWLPGAGERKPAHEILACRSSLVHLPTGECLPGSPLLFTFNALDFDYDPHAPPPTQWLAFLAQLFGSDAESIELLQDWFGYCLTGDTSQQKMLLIVGPPRSGKGTIARILRRLVGEQNTCGPTTSSLAGPFGLQPLLGKSLATVSDARFKGDHMPLITERLLNISGEDPLTIDRKYKSSVTLKLPTRFLFLSNELPQFDDASTALARRFLVLGLTQSFLGREDLDLEKKLLQELPGILNWAIEGWKRLQTRRKFVQPQSSLDAAETITNLSSPVGQFVRERCKVRLGERVSVDELYQAWTGWRQQEGIEAATTKQTFGRQLTSAAWGIKRRRGSGQKPFYDGIGLNGV